MFEYFKERSYRWENEQFDVECNFKCILIVEHYLTAYPAVYGQFPQAIPQQIAAVPAQREGKKLSSKTDNNLLPAFLFLIL